MNMNQNIINYTQLNPLIPLSIFTNQPQIPIYLPMIMDEYSMNLINQCNKNLLNHCYETLLGNTKSTQTENLSEDKSSKEEEKNSSKQSEEDVDKVKKKKLFIITNGLIEKRKKKYKKIHSKLNKDNIRQKLFVYFIKYIVELSSLLARKLFGTKIRFKKLSVQHLRTKDTIVSQLTMYEILSKKIYGKYKKPVNENYNLRHINKLRNTNQDIFNKFNQFLQMTFTDVYNYCFLKNFLSISNETIDLSQMKYSFENFKHLTLSNDGEFYQKKCITYALDGFIKFFSMKVA